MVAEMPSPSRAGKLFRSTLIGEANGANEASGVKFRNKVEVKKLASTLAASLPAGTLKSEVSSGSEARTSAPPKTK
ncbi:hypothetical protein Mapa_002622 [Marchantia paleacea]|nr:hypothetical protein Mapa_002622 [Marchantia paleacea]